MTDRELLELAAKAAGMIPDSFVGNADYMDGLLSGRNPWNPLTDDGDALRLAVALRLVIDAGGGTPNKRHTYIGGPDGFLSFEPHGVEPAAATRRAIVRAAAELGKAMP